MRKTKLGLQLESSRIAFLPTRSFGESDYPNPSEPLVHEKVLDLFLVQLRSRLAGNCDGNGRKEPKPAPPPLNLPYQIAQKQSGSLWVSNHAVLR
jgi:hypothetical protein